MGAEPPAPNATPASSARGPAPATARWYSPPRPPASRAISPAAKSRFAARRIRFRERGGAFYITESYLTGKPQEHRVEYTLGNRRIQHYLTTLPDGRIIVLPPSWDVLRKQWFHNLDIDDPEEEPGVQVQVWNKSCYSCHVSQQEKNFDLDKNAYRQPMAEFRNQLRALPRTRQRSRRPLFGRTPRRKARRATSSCRPASLPSATPWSARNATRSAIST